MNGLRRIFTLFAAATLLAAVAIVGPAFAESGSGKNGSRNSARHGNVSVRAGHSYFARANKKSKKNHGRVHMARKKQKPKPKRRRR